MNPKKLNFLPMKLFKKIALAVLVAILLFVSLLPNLAKVSYAQQSPGTTGVESVWFDSPSWPEWYLKVYDRNSTPADEIFGERYTAAQVEWVFYTIPAMLLNNVLGWDIGSCVLGANVVDCATIVPNRILNMFPFLGSLISNNENPEMPKSFLAALSQKDISAVGYTSRLVKKLTIVQEAKAQGFGYVTGAAPVQTLWAAMRDITYGLLVIVTVILAFMIMFRVKLSPQTVITVQSALPKVILTIILITFSYAIAGLLIDLMYVVIGALSIVISSSGITTNDSLRMFYLLTDGHTIWSLLILYWLWFLIASFTVIFSNPLLGVLSFLFGIIMILVILFFSIKLLWLTMRTFLNILLLIVVGPIQILLGAIMPGMGIGAWAKEMMANLAVYPTIGLMFFVCFFFLRAALPDNPLISPDNSGLFPFDIQGGTLGPTQAWQPPLSFGTQNSGSVAFLWLIASFGVFAGIPKVADIIKGLLSGRPFAYGTAIGEALGGPKMVAGFGAGFLPGYMENAPSSSSGLRLALNRWYTRQNDATRSTVNNILNTVQKMLSR